MDAPEAVEISRKAVEMPLTLWVNMKTFENVLGPTLTSSPIDRSSIRTTEPSRSSTVAEDGKQDLLDSLTAGLVVGRMVSVIFVVVVRFFVVVLVVLAVVVAVELNSVARVD
jgi:hypothetical protein